MTVYLYDMLETCEYLLTLLESMPDGLRDEKWEEMHTNMLNVRKTIKGFKNPDSGFRVSMSMN